MRLGRSFANDTRESFHVWESLNSLAWSITNLCMQSAPSTQSVFLCALNRAFIPIIMLSKRRVLEILHSDSEIDLKFHHPIVDTSILSFHGESTLSTIFVWSFNPSLSSTSNSPPILGGWTPDRIFCPHLLVSAWLSFLGALQASTIICNLWYYLEDHIWSPVYGFVSNWKHLSKLLLCLENNKHLLLSATYSSIYLHTCFKRELKITEYIWINRTSSGKFRLLNKLSSPIFECVS